MGVCIVSDISVKSRKKGLRVEKNIYIHHSVSGANNVTVDVSGKKR